MKIIINDFPLLDPIKKEERYSNFFFFQSWSLLGYFSLMLNKTFRRLIRYGTIIRYFPNELSSGQVWVWLRPTKWQIAISVIVSDNLTLMIIINNYLYYGNMICLPIIARASLISAVEKNKHHKYWSKNVILQTLIKHNCDLLMIIVIKLITSQ